MSTEIATPDPDVEAPPVAELEPEPAKIKKLRPLPASASSDEDESDGIDPERRSRGDKGKPNLSKELLAVKQKEDASLRDIANALGTEGSYKIKVTRLEPEQFHDPATGRMVPVGGFLRNYTSPVDEEVISNNHGGGKFQIQFFRRNQMGTFVHFTQKTLQVVGDPRTNDTFRHIPAAAPAAAPAPAQGDNPKLVEQAFSVLKDELAATRSAQQHHTPDRGPDPGMQALIKVLQDQIAAQDRQMAELRRELADQRSAAAKPVEQDPLQKKMFESLLDGDSARLTTLRENHASEVRQLKQSAIDLEQRLRDQFDRDRADLKEGHKLQIELLKQSHELQLQAAKASFDTSVKVLESDNKRLERENGELKDDNKELRAKKEKGPLEVIKDAEAIKEALGVGDGEQSGIDKAMEVLPGAIEAVKSYFKPPQQQPAQQGAVQQGAQLQTTRKIVRDESGNKYMLDDSGKLTPVKKKPPPPPQPGPNGEPPIPQIPEATINTTISYLERAFAGNQDPDVVAQSGRSMVSPEILQAIRDHGVDGFLTKVAKLPSTSTLANQAGRNWMRKVGKALVGE